MPWIVIDLIDPLNQANAIHMKIDVNLRFQAECYFGPVYVARAFISKLQGVMTQSFLPGLAVCMKDCRNTDISTEIDGVVDSIGKELVPSTSVFNAATPKTDITRNVADVFPNLLADFEWKFGEVWGSFRISGAWNPCGT
jgi:hypothetical protein